MGTVKIGLYKDKDIQIGVVETQQTFLLYKLFAFQPITLTKKEKQVLELIRSNNTIVIGTEGTRGNGKTRNRRVKVLDARTKRKPSKFTTGTIQFLGREIVELIKSPVFTLWRIFIPRKGKAEIRYFLLLHKRYVTPLEQAIPSFKEQYMNEWKPLLKIKKIKWVIKDKVLVQGVSIHDGKLIPVPEVLSQSSMKIGETIPIADAQSILVHVQDRQKQETLPFPVFTPYELSEKGIEFVFPVFMAGMGEETRKITRSLIPYKQIIFTFTPEEHKGLVLFPGAHIMLDPFREFEPHEIMNLLNLSITGYSIRPDVFLMAWDKVKEKLNEEGREFTFEAFVSELRNMEGLAVLSSVQYQVLGSVLTVYEGKPEIFRETTFYGLDEPTNIIIDLRSIPFETMSFFVLSLLQYFAKRASHEMIPIITLDQVHIKLSERHDTSMFQAFLQMITQQLSLIFSTERYSQSMNYAWEEAKMEIMTKTTDTRVREVFEKRHALPVKTSQIIRQLQENEFLLVSPQTNYMVKRITFTPEQPKLRLKEKNDVPKSTKKTEEDMPLALLDWALLLVDAIITEVNNENFIDETLILTALQAYHPNPLALLKLLVDKNYLQHDTENQFRLTPIAEENRMNLRIQLMAWIETKLQTLNLTQQRKQHLLSLNPDTMTQQELWEITLVLAEILMDMNRYADMIHLIWQALEAKEKKTEIRYFKQIINKYIFETQAYQQDDAFPPAWEEITHDMNANQDILQPSSTNTIHDTTSLEDPIDENLFFDAPTLDDSHDNNTRPQREQETPVQHHEQEENHEHNQKQAVILQPPKQVEHQEQQRKQQAAAIEETMLNIPLPGQENSIHLTSLKLIEFTERTLTLLDTYDIKNAINVSLRVVCADNFGFYPQQLNASEILEVLSEPYKKRQEAFPVPLPFHAETLEQELKKIFSYALKKEALTKHLETIEKQLMMIKFNQREIGEIKNKLLRKNNSKDT